MKEHVHSFPTRSKFLTLTILCSVNIALIAGVLLYSFNTYRDQYNYYKNQIVPRQKYISDIKTAFLFDGLLYHFYNYIFTGNTHDVDEFHAKQEGVFNTIRDYNHLDNISPEEGLALDTIYYYVGIYAQNLGLIIRYRQDEDYSLQEIREYLYFNHSDAVKSFSFIESNFSAMEKKSTDDMNNSLTVFLIILFTGLLMLLSSLVFMNYFFFVKPLNTLFGELKMRDDEMSTDMKLAKKVQGSILPRNPDGRGFCRFYAKYLPLAYIGGDFYDILEYKPGVFRVFIADASGHGVQAALITLLIKGEYDKIKSVFDNPSDILAALNREFILNQSIPSYFTCVILDINMRRKTIRYCSAGHPDQYLLSGNAIVPLKSTSRPIGIVPDSVFNSETFEFSQYDRLIMLTDGIFEEFNKENEIWEESRTKDIILKNYAKSLEGIIDELVSEVDHFLAGAPRKDDITLIGIAFNSSPSVKKKRPRKNSEMSAN